MRPLMPICICLSLSSFAIIGANASSPRVAVFYQPGFPYYMVSPLTSPKRIAADLHKAGIPANLLDVKELSNPSLFNVDKYKALILPYGNTYPEAAFANMRIFHKAGGNLILSGVPFTHAVTLQVQDGNQVWHDEGNNSAAALSSDDGMGVGSFASGPQAPVHIANPDLLGLNALHRDWANTSNIQTFDPASIPEQDSWLPILQEGDQPVAALIAHSLADPKFPGAVDVWTHHPDTGDYDGWDSEQMMARGALLSLRFKNLISLEQQNHGFALLDGLPPPHIYQNITLPSPPRPYPTLQPKMSDPARHLYVADVSGLNHDEKVLLITLQGLVNRKQPRIYYLFDNADRFWLKRMQKYGETGSEIAVANPFSLVKRFRSEVRGAVIPDPKVYDSADVAVDIGEIKNLVVSTPELARRLDLPIVEDLRGRFKNDAEALHYLRITLFPRLNPYLAICIDPSILDSGAIDQIVAARGVVFWVTGERAQNLPGADMGGELAEIQALFAKMPLNAVVHGFWWHGNGMGLDEGPGVALGSRFGKITTVSDYVTNYSVMSGVHIPPLRQHFAPPPKLDPSKVYIAITISDGDNLCTWRNYFRGYFQDPLHGTIPIGWGMGPTLRECAPTEAKWYYNHATPDDEFLCDVSGVGYIYPPDWAKSLANRRGALQSFYSLTNRAMQKMDMKTIRLMGVKSGDISEAAHDLPDVRFLMPDYGYQGEKRYHELTYALSTGQAVFRAATDGGPATSLEGSVRQRAGTSRPAFLNVFIENWNSRLKDIKQMLDDLGPGYVPVTPSQLYTLYEQSKR